MKDGDDHWGQLSLCKVANECKHLLCRSCGTSQTTGKGGACWASSYVEVVEVPGLNYTLQRVVLVPRVVLVQLRSAADALRMVMGSPHFSPPLSNASATPQQKTDAHRVAWTPSNPVRNKPHMRQMRHWVAMRTLTTGWTSREGRHLRHWIHMGTFATRWTGR